MILVRGVQDSSSPSQHRGHPPGDRALARATRSVNRNNGNETIAVANMIAQRGISDSKQPGVYDASIPPIRYAAVRAALASVNDYAYLNGYTLHMPRIGCGLAGGDWDEIEDIIKDVMSVDVYVYDLK